MFLKENSDFPPKQNSYYYNKMLEWGAWYSGDPSELIRYYTSEAIGDCYTPATFWQRLALEKNDNDGYVHLPIAGDIAETSSALLFGEAPTFKYDEKTQGGERIKKFNEENNINSLLLEGAEICAALSGCCLKLDIDENIETPVLSLVVPTQFFPSFYRGRLNEILFFRNVRLESDGKCYRLFENRRNINKTLVIEYKLYKGSSDKIGKEIDINSIPETENLNLIDIQYPNVSGLGCVYVPNVKPNKLLIGSSLGINDYSNCISLMDSLDFTWKSLMQDFELGLGQIFIDEELIQKARSASSGDLNYVEKFSKFQKGFVKLNMTSWKMGGENSKPIDIVQFNIRVDEHIKASNDLIGALLNE